MDRNKLYLILNKVYKPFRFSKKLEQRACKIRRIARKCDVLESVKQESMKKNGYFID